MTRARFYTKGGWRRAVKFTVKPAPVRPTSNVPRKSSPNTIIAPASPSEINELR
jgi:hypothetical protein